MKSFLYADEARDVLLDLPIQTAVEQIPLERALGRVLAQELRAEIAMPPFDRSPYDGYALRSDDVGEASVQHPVALRITEEISAGSVPTKVLQHGMAAKVLTGAQLPKGADCTVMYEQIEFSGDMVYICKPMRANQNFICAGEEALAGSLLLERGVRLAPPMLGVLASQGKAVCEVFKRPRVALVVTGSELMQPGQLLVAGKIYNSNLAAIEGYLTQWGLDVELTTMVPDDLGKIVHAVQEGFEVSDIVITTGGASVGDYDFALDVMRTIGARPLFWKVKMKPGSALLAAQKDEKLLLSLSGNPAAAIVGLMRVALPYLRKLCGRRDLLLQEINVELKRPLEKASPTLRLLRGRLEIQDGRALFAENPGSGNGMLSSFEGMDLLGEVAAESPPLKAGTRIKAYRCED